MSNKYAKYFVKPNLKESKKRTTNSSQIVYKENKVNEEYQKALEGKTYYIKTYGCQMNEHDTELMKGLLNSVSMTMIDDVNKADVVIFNTCAIRENAENKVFGEIGRLKHLKLEDPNKIFALCGCMSQEEDVVNRLLTTYTWVDLVFGTHNIHNLVEYLYHAIFDNQKVIEVWSTEGEIIENLPKSRASKTSAWVNIIYGCDKFCTYCIVPYTRGKERSRAPQDIIDEVQQLVDEGYKEVTLLGQNVNSYGKDFELDYSLANLLDDCAKTNIPRLRFTTSHPWDFTDEMVAMIGKHDNIMPHIHLPVQSGNNAILKIMGRSYTREHYIELHDKLRALGENVTVTTDIIVGFPNETDEQFEDTLSLYNYAKFDGAFTFIYSQREGTPAAKMIDNIPVDIKKERLTKLNVLVNQYAKESNKRMQDKQVKVLITGFSNKDETKVVGYTENNKLVILGNEEHLIGEIVDVKIVETRKFNLVGEIINES